MAAFFLYATPQRLHAEGMLHGWQNAKGARVSLIQELRQRVPLTAVLECYGVLSDLKRIGGQLFGVCPIHNGSNRKQFVVDADKSVWKCFGNCDAGGGTLEFVAAMEHTDITHAAKLIERWFSVGSGTSVSQHTRRRTHMSGEKPSHKVFVVEDRGEGDERDAFWTRVGSAAKQLSLDLDC